MLIQSLCSTVITVILLLIFSNLHVGGDSAEPTLAVEQNSNVRVSMEKQKVLRDLMKKQIKDQYTKNKLNKTSSKIVNEFHRNKHIMHDNILHKYLNSEEPLGSNSNRNENMYETYNDVGHIENINAHVHEHYNQAKKKLEEAEKVVQAHNDIRLNIYNKMRENMGKKMKEHNGNHNNDL
jgi:hypothetical protein